jgi:hypothetical protein
MGPGNSLITYCILHIAYYMLHITPVGAHVHKTTYAPMLLYGPVRNVFDGGISITWASGRGLGHFTGPRQS